MATIKVYNQQGQAIGEQQFSDAAFGVTINPAAVYQAAVAQQANARTVLAHAKDRSEVRGGGRKPWRQKGTGRARHGSIRSPLWRGGGVTFGPTKDRNFSLKINKKAKRKALAMSLTDKVANGNMLGLDALELAEVKTKKLFELLRNLQLRQSTAAASKKAGTPSSRVKKIESVLLIIDKKNDLVSRSGRNIPKVRVITAGSLNIVEVLKAAKIVATVAALKKIEENLIK